MDKILDSVADGVLELSLNRPDKLNAIDLDMYRRLAECLQAAGEDPAVRVILLRAEGEHFTAGNDLADFAAMAELDSPPLLDEIPTLAFLLALNACEKPIVAAVQGRAIGVGLTLLLHCDFVHAGRSATLRAPFVELGLVPEAGASWILPRLVGRQRAGRVLIDGEELSAEQAHRWGIVARVVDDVELQDSARDHARRLARMPARAVLQSRALLHNDRDAVAARIREEARLFVERLRSAEARQALAKFLRPRS